MMGLMAGADVGSDTESTPQPLLGQALRACRSVFRTTGFTPTPGRLEFAARGRQANPCGRDTASVSACVRAQGYLRKAILQVTAFLD